ncbi:MAG: enoyl-CoA hydratase/isomerase family protein [Phycisphaerae bacterium]|nr:enoyl-CoA hydratase/isomerase family protein [Phycisphaerae bacterium]
MLATLTIEGCIGTLTLNRPEARNALSLDLLEELHARVDEVSRRSDVNVIVLTGAGKAFCAGMDLRAVLDAPSLALTLLRSLADLTLKLRALSQVTVARVQGAAIGGGCGLTTVCDFAITHADSKMGFPEVDLGVCPAVVAPWLVRKLGAGRARAVLLRGGLMSGDEALAIGLVTLVTPAPTDLGPATDELVSRLATGGPAALAATKRLLNELDGSLDADIVRKGAELSARVLCTPEAQARLRARLTG